LPVPERDYDLEIRRKIMADLLTKSVFETYNNAGTGVSKVGDNAYKHRISQSDAGREFIVSITADSGQLTEAKLTEAIQYLTRNNYLSTNTDATSAGTIAGLGTSDGTPYDVSADTVVFVRFQTTEDFAVTDFNAGDATGVTLAVVAQFRPAL
jgi:hypothetical protein